MPQSQFGHVRSSTLAAPSSIPSSSTSRSLSTKHNRSATNDSSNNAERRQTITPRNELRGGNGNQDGNDGGLTAWEFLKEVPKNARETVNGGNDVSDPSPSSSLPAPQPEDPIGKGKGKERAVETDQEPSASHPTSDSANDISESKTETDKDTQKDRVEISISPLVDVITMFGSTQTSSNYSLSGRVVLSVRPRKEEGSRSRFLPENRSTLRSNTLASFSGPPSSASNRRPSSAISPTSKLNLDSSSPLQPSSSKERRRPETIMSPISTKSLFLGSDADKNEKLDSNRGDSLTDIPTPTLSELRAFARKHSGEGSSPLVSPTSTPLTANTFQSVAESSPTIDEEPTLQDLPPVLPSPSLLDHRFSTATTASYATAQPSPSLASPSLMVTSPSIDSITAPMASSQRRKLKAVAAAAAKLRGGDDGLGGQASLEEENESGNESSRSSMSEPKTPKSVMAELGAAVAESEARAQNEEREGEAGANDEAEEQKPSLQVTSLKVNFSGYSMYVDSAGRFAALKLADLTQELLPQGSTLPLSSAASTDGTDPQQPLKYEIEFDFSIPGWLPASMRSRFGGNFYCISSQAEYITSNGEMERTGTSSDERALSVISPSSPHVLADVQSGGASNSEVGNEAQEVLQSPAASPSAIKDSTSTSERTTIPSSPSSTGNNETQFLSAPSVGPRRGSSSGSIGSATEGGLSSGNSEPHQRNSFNPTTSIFGEAPPISSSSISTASVSVGGPSTSNLPGSSSSSSVNAGSRHLNSQSPRNSSTPVSKAKGNWLSKGAKRLTIMGRPSSVSSPRSSAYDTKMLDQSRAASSIKAMGVETSTSTSSIAIPRSRTGQARTSPLQAGSSGASSSTLVAHSNATTIIIRRCREIVAVPVARLALLAPGEESAAAQDSAPVNNPESANEPSAERQNSRPDAERRPAGVASSAVASPMAESSTSQSRIVPHNMAPTSTPAPPLPPAKAVTASTPSVPPPSQAPAPEPVSRDSSAAAGPRESPAPPALRPSQLLPLVPSALSGPSDPSKFAAAAAAAAQQPVTPARNASSTGRSSRGGSNSSNPPMRHFLHRPVLHPPAEAGIEGEGLLFSLTLSLPSHVQVDGPNSDTLSFGVQIEVGRTEGWTKVRELGGLRLRDMELVCLQTERHT